MRNQRLVNSSDLSSFVVFCYNEECSKKPLRQEMSGISTRVNTQKEVNNLTNDMIKSYMNNTKIPNMSLISSSIFRKSMVSTITDLLNIGIFNNNIKVKKQQKLPFIQPNNLTTDSFLTRFRDHKLVDYIDMRDYQNRKVYLFVINFHHVKYGSAAFIRNEIYSSFAKNYPYDFDLFLIGPKKDIENKIYGNGLLSKGHYAYHSMKIALDLFSPETGYNYAGYFEANDDSCLQPILLGRENHDRAMSEGRYIWSKNEKWMWNHMFNKNRTLFSVAYLNAVSEISSHPSLSNICKFNSSQLRQGWGDFFYFPKSNLTTFLKLESVMFKHYVFLENAISFIMECVDATVIKDCNHGKMLEREFCPHLHPLKFSRSEDRNICLHRINNITLSERPKTWYFVC